MVKRPFGSTDMRALKAFVGSLVFIAGFERNVGLSRCSRARHGLTASAGEKVLSNVKETGYADEKQQISSVTLEIGLNGSVWGDG